MKGWIFANYGGPEVLEWADLPDPVAGKGGIVVRVVAAALNPLDWKLRSGQFRLMTAGRLPRGVGYDYAGVVESAGEDVTRLKPGQAVVGIVNPMKSRHGAMAERVCATEALAAEKPASLSFADGASLPGAGVTAVQALRDARLAAGRRVLVVGAAGGVGSFAVQLAKEAVLAGMEAPLSSALALEVKSLQILFSSQDQKEGMRAFVEKRPARWTGT